MAALTIKEYLVGKLTVAEGRRKFPYDDETGKTIVLPSGGNVTIGVGINLSAGLYDDEIDYLLNRRIERAIEDAKKIPVYRNCSPARKAVLVEMVFNIGLDKVLGFKNMLSNLRLGAFDKAAAEMLNSKWADDVGNRAIQLAEVMRSGQVEGSPDLVE